METYGDFLRDISTKDNLYVFCSGPFDVQSKEEFVNDYVELNNYRDTILDSFKWSLFQVLCKPSLWCRIEIH